MSSQKWFAIISQGRTGSCLLTRALDSRPDIQMLEEILHPNCGIKLPHEDGRRRILAAFSGAEREVDAIGLKLHVTQPSTWMPQWESAWRVIEDHEDIKLIVLSRRDVIAQLASYKIARITGLWEDQSRLESRPTFRIEPEELRWFAEYQRGMLQARIAPINERRMYKIHYEDLVGNWQLRSAEIIEFLGLPLEPRLPMPTLKQEHRPIEEIVENYQEIAF